MLPVCNNEKRLTVFLSQRKLISPTAAAHCAPAVIGRVALYLHGVFAYSHIRLQRYIQMPRICKTVAAVLVFQPPPLLSGPVSAAALLCSIQSL